MHIAFLTNEYPPLPTGGIGTSIRNLARALVVQGHQITILGWGPPGDFEDQGVHIHMLGATGVPKLGWLLNRQRAQQELNRLVRREGLAIVEAPDWCGPSAGMRLECPLVIRCHGSATYFADLLHEPVRSSVYWAERLALRQATSVGAVSRFTATVTSQLFRLDNPVRVIPNGIDIRQFQPAPVGAQATDTILYFGTLVRKKGLLDLCTVFPQILEHYPQARLRLVGRDSADQRTGAPSTWELCRQLLAPEALNRVEYIGPRPYGEVQEYVQHAVVCVFPSYAEALPLSWLEAMACAKTVIAYDIGWAPEIINSGVNGLHIARGALPELAQSIVGILADADRNRALGTAARQTVEQLFSAPVVATATLDWYRQVLAAC